MITRMLALLTVILVIFAPMILIVWLALAVSWVAWGYLLVHLWILKNLADWITKFDFEISGGGLGGKDVVGTGEKVEAVIKTEKSRKMKRFR